MPGRIDQGTQNRNPFLELSIENDGKQPRDIDPGFSVGAKDTRDIDPGFNVGGKDKKDIDPGFSFGEKQTRKAEAGIHGQISKSDLLDRLKYLNGPKRSTKQLRESEQMIAIADALSGLNKKERDQLEKEYKKKYGKSLDDALKAKLAGLTRKQFLRV